MTATAASNQAFDADVAIVGYGPTGVSAANFLAAYGMRTIAFERESDVYPRARAVTINDWTLRCFQSVGLDQDLLRDMDPTTALRWRSYAGKELFRSGIKASTLGQPTSSMIYQPVMEQTLRRNVERFPDLVTVNFGQAVTHVEQDSTGIAVSARDEASGAITTTRARYLLACDGGASGVRSQLGIKLLGSTLETLWVVIDARVKRWWPERHLLTFWSDPLRPVVDIPLALGNHRWEFPLDASESRDDFARPEQLWPLLSAMGVTPEHVDIHQHAFYKHHVRRAEHWRNGRVFLLGDAAHMMPPWAGQGMQSGIRDAFNLCWKLREVVAGRLPDSLLDSYEVERAPNVAMITAVSEQLGRIIKMQMTRKEKARALMRGLLLKLGVAPPAMPHTLPPSIGRGWLRGDVDPRGAVGKMIPQPMVADARGKQSRLDQVLGHGFVLLGDGVDPTTMLSTAERASWDALGARYMAVRPCDQSATSDSDLLDLSGQLGAWLRSHRAVVAALRPDRFVAAADGSGLGVPDRTGMQAGPTATSGAG